MLYLLLAIASSAIISILMRFSEKHIKTEMGMFMANYAACVLLSFLFMNKGVDYFASTSLAPMLGLGVISGVLYLVSFLFLKFNMKHNGIVMASTFMKLGVLIPTLMAIIIFREVPKATQIIGIILSLIAIVLLHFEKEGLQSEKTSGQTNKKVWLLLLLLLSGITDSMANIYEKVGSASVKDGYLLITFATAFLLTVYFTLTGKEKVSGKDLLFGLLIGIPNYFSARFLLLALGEVAAVLVYPMYSVATMITIALAGVFIFKETVSKKKVFALGLIVVALCLLNM